ncbi:cytidylate kinase [Aequitasia blattaphilus]|uniref:Cytidylate kinase n=1 Tax=Aequitasia blattaphilus TaxID=2949332 RepID=A0ABT1E5L0_9FIRM|nr:(d)CMP kinase [Aequitasia blattaphilus]MCP1101127.1 (d)CMP kinase [Aequitasia blattaphilus]MCR8613767.1 (d)CMP kinase [Aequitasia blattaphilus]
MGYQIAIDGPAGAGKSTIAKEVARRKGYIYVDTGALYRGIAYFLLERGIKADEQEKIIEVLPDIQIEIRYEKRKQEVYLNGNRITHKIRTEEVGNMASKVSSLKAVRDKLLQMQRDLGNSFDVVMDGRDIGTNVLKDANVKIFLTASSRTRAMRRMNQLKRRGLNPSIDEIERDIIIRDKQDSTREIAPLKQAEDAIRIDSSNLSIREVVNRILKECK